MKLFTQRKFAYLIFLVIVIGAILIFFWNKNLHNFVTIPYHIPELKFFPKKVNLTKKNPLSVEGVRLGRFLFYDGRLSGSLHPDSLRSCASCHIQQKAFAGEIAISTQDSLRYSLDRKLIKSRNHDVLPLINLIYNRKGFFWNGFINVKNTDKGPSEELKYQSLEDIVWISIVSEECMGGSINKTVELISSVDMYRSMFKDAFGTEKINIERIDFAIAQFLRSIIAYRFKLYDYMKGDVQLESNEIRGYELFHSEKAGCFHCHSGSLLMTTNEYYNNGLKMDPLDSNDRFVVTNYIKDRGAYRAPSLINCEVTGPYMHDGRFQTLDEVLDFYSEGIQYSEFTDPLIKEAIDGGIHLSDSQKSDLKAFLFTLTDRSILSDSSFSVPGELGVYGIKHSAL